MHRTLVAGPFRLSVATHALFGKGTTFSVGGYELYWLDPGARFSTVLTLRSGGRTAAPPAA